MIIYKQYSHPRNYEAMKIAYKKLLFEKRNDYDRLANMLADHIIEYISKKYVGENVDDNYEKYLISIYEYEKRFWFLDDELDEDFIMFFLCGKNHFDEGLNGLALFILNDVTKERTKTKVLIKVTDDIVCGIKNKQLGKFNEIKQELQQVCRHELQHTVENNKDCIIKFLNNKYGQDAMFAKYISLRNNLFRKNLGIDIDVENQKRWVEINYLFEDITKDEETISHLADAKFMSTRNKSANTIFDVLFEKIVLFKNDIENKKASETFELLQRFVFDIYIKLVYIRYPEKREFNDKTVYKICGNNYVVDKNLEKLVKVK